MGDPPHKNGDKNGHHGPNGAASNGKGALHFGAEGGDEEDDETPEGEPAASPVPPPPSPAPPAIVELCAACMRFIGQKYKVSLDGTPDTLSLVDQYVRDAREAVRERPEAVELVAPAIGAYFGEVVRQTFGGEWFAEGDHSGYRLYFTHVYLAFNPIGMAREAITMREEEGWHAHMVLDPGERELIEERLAIIPEVDEEEYYLPTTRFDVLTVVVETLRARAEGSGTGDVTFSAEDYD